MPSRSLDRTAKSNVIRLAAAQALAGANASVIYATGAIIGATLAPSPAYATLPISILVIGTAAGTLPIGWIATHHGRRAAFIAGTACGVATGLLAAIALLIGSFPLYCAATFLGGLYAAVVVSFRFAAADGTTPNVRAKAVSWVMAGGVFSGVLGPQLVNWTMHLWEPYLFVASYLAQSVVALVAMAVLSGVDLPKPPPTASAGRPLMRIAAQPKFSVAVLCGVASYTLMNLVMTSAPLAMRLCGLDLGASNTALQWHIVAMYGPSFFTGKLIVRFGAPRIIAMGLLCTAAAAATGLAGITATHFSIELVLLGLGWNFGFVGASSLVLETHRPEERTRVQSFNDFLVFGTMTIGSFAAGGVLANEGWSAINWIVFPPVALTLAALLLVTARRKPALPIAGG